MSILVNRYVSIDVSTLIIPKLIKLINNYSISNLINCEIIQ